jgi:hypothetical protein
MRSATTIAQMTAIQMQIPMHVWTNRLNPVVVVFRFTMFPAKSYSASHTLPHQGHLSPSCA